MLFRSPEAPDKFTWIDAFGRPDVVFSYERGDSEFSRQLQAATRLNPSEFDESLAMKLAQVTIDEDTPWPRTGKKVVGGPIDAVVIEPGKPIRWLQVKPQCRPNRVRPPFKRSAVPSRSE